MTVMEVGADTSFAVAMAILALGANRVFAVNSRFDKNIQAPDSRIVIVNTDLENASLSEDCVDSILGMDILPSIANLSEFVRACRKVLKAGGSCYLHGSPMWTGPAGHYIWLSKTPSGTKYFFNSHVNLWEHWAHLLQKNKAEAVEALKAKNIPETDAELIAYDLFKTQNTARKPPTEIENVFLAELGSKCEIFRNEAATPVNEYFQKALLRFTERDLRCIEMEIRYVKNETLEKENAVAGQIVARGVQIMQSKREKPYIIRYGSFATFFDLPIAVNWSLTDMCNYDCSYCFGHEKLDKSKFTPFLPFLNTIDNLAALNRPSYSFTIGGGEPTTHPRFLDILQLIAAKFGNKIDKTMVISNGSREIEFYEKLMELAESLRLILIYSIHTDHVKEEHLYKLIEKISPKIHLNLSLMLNPAKYELTKKLFENLLQLRSCYPFSLAVSPLREPPRFDILDKRYTPEHLTWQKEANSRFAIAKNSSNAAPPAHSTNEWEQFHEVIIGSKEEIGTNSLQMDYLILKKCIALQAYICLLLMPKGIVTAFAALKKTTLQYFYTRNCNW